MSEPCLLCDWAEADRQFQRVEVWEDELWRLTTSLVAPVAGFSYLEPKRHIPSITELDGAEAATLGPILARVTRVLRDAVDAELVYVNVFGERVAHLHFNLAPHRAGDALQGGRVMLADGAEPLPRADLEQIAGRVRAALGGA
jgi:diadenosine tetraphosphate (Ap4A) HIT family hydrolase